MLNNIDFSDINTMLFELQNSDLDFYLTGSRFFNTNNKNSDYDFFVEDSPRVRQLLKNLGFERLNNSAYLDNNTIIVYRYISKNRDIWCPGHIDVQIVIDAVKKQCVQNIIKYNNFIMTSDKTYAKTVWNTLMAIYDTAKTLKGNQS